MEHSFDSPTPPQTLVDQDACPTLESNGNDDYTASRPLSGPGSSRQTRRLQLRNAGFRGATVPARRVTPKSQSTSNEWEPLMKGGSVDLSDIENTPPSQHASSVTSKRRSSAILQEIDNVTLTRSKKQRQRRQLSKQLTRSSGEYGDVDRPVSPSSPRGTIRPRGLKTRAKVVQRRRSLSAEANKYIEHLETQLAETQSQLDAASRPSITAEKPSNLRSLAMEAERLQEELDAWEEMYDERLNEEIEKHRVVESALRERIDSMENDADEMKIRIEELRVEAETANGTLQAVETANTLLEKRVEMMSELLAASKVDLYAGTRTPAGDRRHARLKSMVPLFPSAKSLGTSPERQSNTRPSSPRPQSPRLMSFQSMSTASPVSPPHRKAASVSDASPLATHSVSEILSDAESVFSEALTAGDSMTSAENFEGISSLNAWGIPVLHQQQPGNKPARRMRRFVGGSMGPKPLILPSTNQSYYGPVSAPPMERRETSPAYFPTPTRKLIESEVNAGRRRSSTTANELSRCDFSSSPLSSSDSPPLTRKYGSRDFGSRDFGSRDFGSRDFSRPMSSDSQSTTRRPFSIGSPVGRSLMEELNTAWTSENMGSIDQTCEMTELLDSNGNELYMSRIPEDEERPATAKVSSRLMETPPHSNCVIDASGYVPTFDGPVIPEITTQSPSTATMDASSSEASAASSASNPHDPGPDVETKPQSTTPSFFERMRLLFGDLWRSPVALARHLVQTAQTRMRIPEPLRNVQWWLVSFLLGPMAKRRMLARSAACAANCNRPPDHEPGGDGRSVPNGAPRSSGIDRPPNEGEPPGPGQPSNFRHRSAAAGKEKTRPLQRPPCSACRLYGQHQSQYSSSGFSKHSPWLWLKFSLTLAFAIGTAFTHGPGHLLRTGVCSCQVRRLKDGCSAGRKMIAAE